MLFEEAVKGACTATGIKLQPGAVISGVSRKKWEANKSFIYGWLRLGYVIFCFINLIRSVTEIWRK